MKKKLNLDLEVRKLTKRILKGEYTECPGQGQAPCKCGKGTHDD